MNSNGLHLRGRQLLVDALVAIAEQGNLTDADIALIKAHELDDMVKDKLFRRAASSSDIDRLFDAIPLAWEARDH